MQPQPYQKLRSELQEKILKHICITANADYKTVSKETNRDRVTILQSLKPLIKRKYIRSIKLNPTRIKSKLVFRPTEKGMMYSTAYLGVHMDDIRDAQLEDDALKNYRVFLKEVRDPRMRKQLEQLEPQTILSHDLFDENGDLIFRNREEYLKQGLRIMVLGQTSDKRFDIEDLFKFPFDQIKAAHPIEVDLFKDMLIKIRNNLEASLKQLSD